MMASGSKAAPGSRPAAAPRAAYLLLLLAAATPALAEDMPPDPLAARLAEMALVEQAYARLLERSLSAAEPAEQTVWALRAGALLLDHGDWVLALRHFQHEPALPGATLAQGYSLYRDGKPRAAWDLVAQDPTVQAAYLRGWCALDAHDRPQALQDWALIPTDHPLALSSQPLLTTLQAWQPAHRSPTAAGLLSAVVPGAGQAYVGRWGEAFSALLVNAGLIGAGYELARRDLWFGFGLISFFELGFYGGNIFSAVNGARRFDRLAWQEPWQGLRPQHAPHLSLVDDVLTIVTAQQAVQPAVEPPAAIP